MVSLAKKLGIQINPYGFCQTGRFAPVETSKPGIYVCGAFSGPKDIPETVMQASGAAGSASALLAPARKTLVKEKDAFDVFRAAFPAGTVSGAPKIRAMEIIEELEPERRELYAGAVGYAGFDRTLEFAITIRTIVARGRKAEVQVGAGIVADSDPGKEWEETENKGMALVRAIELVEGSE
jgi:hypothetical protein